jgi:hypothetical protein
MVIPPARIITVNIVTSVILVIRIQSLDSHAILLHQNVLNVFDTDSSMIFLEKVWSISHGNAEVGTKLVISVAMSGLKDVLINASPVDEISLNHILWVFFGFHRHPVASLEVKLNPVGPLLVGP